MDLSVPKVMGIINVTPDSFYAGSRFSDSAEIIGASHRMINEGADILDIGGHSTRPGAAPVPVDEEMKRVCGAVRLIRSEFPGIALSVDTFRASVAAEAVSRCGADIINDVSGGEADRDMFAVAADLRVPYILMHMQGTPQTMQANPLYDDVVADILFWMSSRIERLKEMGLNDIIIDPGFGFGKTIKQNFELLDRLGEFSVAGLPVLAGVSRKSMIWKTLGVAATDAGNGTTALNMAALYGGADILRVHDVKEAVEAVTLFAALKGLDSSDRYGELQQPRNFNS
ncbi:MAG: dihydropteroate synthase [Bacteroidales bacterium]|jgi:dihydropteroate synthase|nr:dihydropteroate synthase [Bacteroidales bacterium]MCU0408133.1 dihydropteroate synthase [Bacteroidales bacterium]